MVQHIIQDAKARMQKSIEAFKSEMSKLRTGRAHPSLLDHIFVEYYGNPTPLNQVANISASDARTLTITPWEKKLVPLIEKAILNSDLGLNPATTGDIIRVPLPALNEERRKELIKILRGEAENARVGVRNVRRDANAQIKELQKAKTITEDEEHRWNEEIQKLTDKTISEIDQLLSAKEVDLMAV